LHAKRKIIKAPLVVNDVRRSIRLEGKRKGFKCDVGRPEKDSFGCAVELPNLSGKAIKSLGKELCKLPESKMTELALQKKNRCPRKMCRLAILTKKKTSAMKICHQRRSAKHRMGLQLVDHLIFIVILDFLSLVSTFDLMMIWYWLYLYGPNGLYDYMVGYFAIVMRSLLGLFWTIFGWVICLLMIWQYLHLLLWYRIFVGDAKRRPQGKPPRSSTPCIGPSSIS
jgi:hypothetical protein